jgi:cyclohexyl-isocyanide hydratase
MPASSTPPPDERPLQIGVLVFPGFEPLDAIGPAQVFWTLTHASPAERPLAEVHLVAPQDGPVTAGHGMVLLPTRTYATCPPLDLLVVAGGGGRRPEDGEAVGVRWFARDGATADFVRAQAASARVVASVCTGSFILAGAGLLAGRRATTHWASRDALVKQMADRGEPFTLVAERVVDDGDVVTAGGVSSGIDLALHLVQRLFGDEVHGFVRLGIEIETPALA